MLDFADIVAINKFDKKGALDALRDVKKQYRRNHNYWDGTDADLPIYGTIASQFNDPGMNTLYRAIIQLLNNKAGAHFGTPHTAADGQSVKIYVIPPDRNRYLAELVEENERYGRHVAAQAAVATKLGQVQGTMLQLGEAEHPATPALQALAQTLEEQLDGESRRLLREWPTTQARYTGTESVYEVRGKQIRTVLTTESLSGLQIRKVALPRYTDPGDTLRWLMTENLPGEFPYAAGVFPFKRTEEDPTRMFAGEGGPERTNKRFHYVSLGQPAKRLSTAFDSVTLYGEDPRPPARHLWQNRKFGRVHRHPGRCQEALQRLRLGRPQNIGIDDD